MHNRQREAGGQLFARLDGIRIITSLHDGVRNIELKAVTESAKNFSSGSLGVDETALLRGPG